MSDTPDDLELVPDDLEVVPDDLEPAQPTDQGPPLDWAGARQALDEMAAGVKPSTLGPGAQQALLQIFAAKRGPAKIGALDAMNATGANMALMGLPQAVNPEARAYLDEARRQHPGGSAASEILGGAASGAMLPAGKLAAGIQGGMTGWNMSQADNTGDRIGDALMGAGVGAGVAHFAPHAFRVAGEFGDDIANGARRAGGAGLSKLAELLGYKAPVAAAPVVDGAAQRASGYASVADDVAAANPRQYGPSQARSMSPRGEPAPAAPATATLEEQLADASRANAAGDLDPARPRESAHRFAGRVQRGVRAENAVHGGPDLSGDLTPEDEAALMRLQGRAQESPLGHMVEPAPDAAKSSLDPPTKNARIGDIEGDTQIATLDDVLDLKGRAMRDNIDRVSDIMPYDDGAPIQNWSQAHQAKSPTQQASATFDNANEAMNFSSLDDIVAGGQGSPKPQAAPVSPIDAKKQAIIDAQMANPEALEAFGVDPRKGERGFDPFMAYGAYKGIQGAVKGAKAAAPAIGRAGEALTQAASPDAIARRAISDPNVLFMLAKDRGALGGAARAMLEAFQAGDQKALKARAALLATMPEFRQKFAPGTGEQDRSVSAASGF